jgi:PST family polysaccharide transporter
MPLHRLKVLTVKGTLWALSESFGVAGLSFIVFVVLARLLTPQDFGIVALAGVFIFSFNLLLGHSFADALVQRARLEPEHLDTVFWTTLGLALTLTAICWAAAAPMARWFGEPRLAEVLPALSLILPLNAIGAVQTSLFRRELRFRTVATRSVTGRLVGAAAGIGMAAGGLGVWSLVGQQLAAVATVGLAMAAASPWRPRWRFSLPHLRDLWRFGFFVSAGQVVGGLGEQAVNLLVGGMLGSTVLGYFTIAWRMAQLLRTLVGSAVYHVGLSAFARLQEDRELVARAMLKATSLGCLFGFPIAAAMAVLASPLVTATFGVAWQASVPLLAILAIDMFTAFYGLFFTACYRALGRAGWAFGLAAAYVAVGIAAIYLAMPLGIEAVAAAWVVKSMVLLPVQVLLLARLLEVRVRVLAAPPLAPLAASAAMALVLAAIRWTLGDGAADWTVLLVGLPVGAVTYVAVIALIAPELIRTTAGAVRLSVAPTSAAIAPDADAAANPKEVTA